MANARSRLAGCAAALLLASAPGLASADVPTGSFEFQLGGANSLWMGGDVDTHEDADGFCASFGGGFDEVELCDYELTVDGRGKIGGYVEFIGRIGGTRVAIEGPIKGAQRGNNRSGITRAAFVIRLAGTATRNGLEWRTSLSLKLVAQTDAGGVLNGTWTQKFCDEGSPCETSSWPAGPTSWDDGHWTLALALEADRLGGGEIGGSARIVFGDATYCDFAVDGYYDATKDAASVSLAPISLRCAGGSLRLRFLKKGPGRSAGVAHLALLQYKLLGVTGTTAIHTDFVALNRNPLDSFFNAPDFGFSPPSSSSSSSSSGLISTFEFPQNLGPPPVTQASSSSSSSASATLVMYVISSQPPPMISQLPPTQGALVQTSVNAVELSSSPPRVTFTLVYSPPVESSGSVSAGATDVLEDSAGFETLQSGARFELLGFEARPVGPVLDATPADPLGTSAELPGVHPLTQY